MSDDEEKDEAESSEDETESSDSESSDSESSDSESSDSESSDSESSSAEDESDSESDSKSSSDSDESDSESSDPKSEAESDSDEDAAEAKPEPVAAPKKGKKKKKGAKSKSADTDEGGSDKAKRSSTKKRSAASRSSTRTASARTEEARPKKPGSPEDEETPWGLVAGAVAVAVACVIGLYYFNHRASSEDEPTADIAIDTGDTAHDEAAPSPSADPFAAPPDVAAPPANAQRTPSGLASRVIRPGTGTTHPSATDRVTVHYTGWTTDGQMFDSSRRRGEPTTFPLNRVIAGWTEGVQLMVVGEQRRFWIPEALAYQGRPGAPAGMLVFDVELIGINQ